MTKTEAREALLEGKKVKPILWPVGRYIYFDFEGLCLYDDSGEEHSLSGYLEKGNSWELHEEKQNVTLYKYTFKSPEGFIEETSYSSKTFDVYCSDFLLGKSLKLLKTETKEVDL